MTDAEPETKAEEAPETKAGIKPDAVATYRLICYVSLGAMVFAGVQQGFVLAQLLVAAVGVFGVLARLRHAPVIVLILIGFTQLFTEIFFNRSSGGARLAFLDVEDVLLSMGALGYVAGHYRLQSLRNFILTPDPRRRLRPARKFLGFPIQHTPLQQERRASEDVSPAEINLFVVSLPLWALVAQGLLLVISMPREVFGIRQNNVRLMLALWLVVVGVFVVRHLFELWKRRRMTPEAAELYLQDVVWRETRGEQRRVQRWLAWFRRRNP